jgi:hypothetical protein
METMAIDANNRVKMQRWLKPLAFPFDSDEQPRADKLVVHHVTVNDKTSEVMACKVPGDFKEEDMEGLILRLEMAMLDDAEGFGGVQRYLVRAYAKKQSIGRLALRYKASLDEEDISSSEPATEKGVTAMLMRHLEAKERIYASGFAQLIDQQSRQLADRERLIEMYSGRFIETQEAFEELMSLKHERDLQTSELESKTKMKQMLVDKAALILPAIASRLGLPVVGAKEDAKVQTLKGVLRTLKPEQLEQISAALTPEQGFALMTLMEDDIKEDTAIEASVVSNGKRS